jgi:hypothetical protein
VFRYQARDVGPEELSDVLLEPGLEEYFVQEAGARIVASWIVPPDHEVVAIRTVSNGFLVHHGKTLSVFEDLLAAFVGVNSDDFHVALGTLEIVEINDFILLQDSICCLRSIEREEDVWRGACPGCWKAIKEEMGQHAAVRSWSDGTEFRNPPISEGAAIEIVSKKTVTTDESYCVVKDPSTSGLAWTDTATGHGGLGAFRHQAGVQFKIINMAVQKFSGSGGFFVRIPFFEALIFLQVEISTESGRC